MKKETISLLLVPIMRRLIGIQARRPMKTRRSIQAIHRRYRIKQLTVKCRP